MPIILKWQFDERLELPSKGKIFQMGPRPMPLHCEIIVETGNYLKGEPLKNLCSSIWYKASANLKMTFSQFTPYYNQIFAHATFKLDERGC